MDGYLIDTNIVNFWHNSGLLEHVNVMARVTSLPAGTPFYISVVTIGEIYFGHRSTSNPDRAKQQALERFVQIQFPNPLPISQHTPQYYAEIRYRLFHKYPPASKKHRRPEQCLEPVTALELGIDENDLWIASQAVEHRLVLVTHDRMARIRDVTSGLLDVEDWTL